MGLLCRVGRPAKPAFCTSGQNPGGGGQLGGHRWALEGQAENRLAVPTRVRSPGPPEGTEISGGGGRQAGEARRCAFSSFFSSFQPGSSSAGLINPPTPRRARERRAAREVRARARIHFQQTPEPGTRRHARGPPLPEPPPFAARPFSPPLPSPFPRGGPRPASC